MASLVIGPTCVGKSTFIDQCTAGPSASVVLGYEVPEKGVPEGTKYVHYNLFHPWSNGSFSGSIKQRLSSERIFSAILAATHVTDAIVLVAQPADLRDRILLRTQLEPVLRPTDEAGYSPDFWLTILEQLDLFRLYEDCFEILQEYAIEFQCRESLTTDEDAPSFKPIDRLHVHSVLRGLESTTLHSEEQVKNALQLPGAHYQSVLLPGGVSNDLGGYSHVKSGRHQTFNQVFEFADLRGASILDIGCALGDFLFRAELRGAESMVGLEPHAERFAAATEFGRLRDSSVVFMNSGLKELGTDVPSAAGLPGQFDWVLALNVLHHVSDLRCFVADAVRLTSRHLVIEFPTLSDPIWIRDNEGAEVTSLPDLDHLPLIGVGLRGYDQQFVFNDQAVVSMVAGCSQTLQISRIEDSFIEHRRLAIFCAFGGCRDCCEARTNSNSTRLDDEDLRNSSLPRRLVQRFRSIVRLPS